VKIKLEHYLHMKEAMRAAQANKPLLNRSYYEANKIGQDCAKRHRWDLFYAAKLTLFACDVIYKYADDTHIDTALRSIVKELELNKEAP